MNRNATLGATKVARYFEEKQVTTTSSSDISRSPPIAQVELQSVAEQLAGDGIHCGSLWKSPRDKRQCISVSLRSYEGNPYCDVRIHELDQFGRMRPTQKGITVSIAKLGALSQAIGTGYRKAVSLGLISGVSS